MMSFEQEANVLYQYYLSIGKKSYDAYVLAQGYLDARRGGTQQNIIEEILNEFPKDAQGNVKWGKQI